MTEERLKEIKDSIEFQAIYIKEHNFETALLEEETDLYNEVINLKNENEKLKEELNKHIKEGIEKDIIIDKAIEYIDKNSDDMHTYISSILLDILQGSDKE